MWIWILFCIYAFMSATGLLLIKIGTDEASFCFQNNILSLQVTPRLLFGFMLYLLSFLLSIYIMSRLKLSLFYPVATGSIIMLTCVYGFFFLNEKIGIPQILGIALILAGIISINVNP